MDTKQETTTEGPLTIRKTSTGRFVIRGGLSGMRGNTPFLDILEIMEIQVEFNLDGVLTIRSFQDLEEVGRLYGHELIDSPFGSLNAGEFEVLIKSVVLGDTWKRVVEDDHGPDFMPRNFDSRKHLERWHPEHIPYIVKLAKLEKVGIYAEKEAKP